MPARKTTKKTPGKKAAKKKRASKRIKTGYARAVNPTGVEAEESAGLTVPVASRKGHQEGRIPPGNRKYGAGRYEVVSATEATDRRMKRERGEMDFIPGGLDDNDLLPPETEGDLHASDDDYDPLGGPPRESSGEAPPIEAKLSVRLPPSALKLPEPPAEQKYLNKRCRVSLDLTDGTMRLAAIDVTQTRYSVTVLLPLSDEGMTFIPQPGIEVSINSGQNRWECYFPGTYFEFPELKVIGLVFVKKVEGNG